jgi:hypothetical protein
MDPTADSKVQAVGQSEYGRRNDGGRRYDHNRQA